MRKKAQQEGFARKIRDKYLGICYSDDKAGFGVLIEERNTA
jgi:hypothetical protein